MESLLAFVEDMKEIKRCIENDWYDLIDVAKEIELSLKRLEEK